MDAVRQALELEGNPLPLAKAVAASFALPADFEPIRVSDVYSAEDTAVAQPVTNFKVQWDCVERSPALSARQLAVTDWGLFVFPNLLRHTVQYLTFPDPYTSDYSAVFGLAALNSTESFRGGININLEPTGFENTAGSSPHGPLLFCARSQGRVGVWIDNDAGGVKSTVIHFQFSAAPANTDNFEFQVYRHASGWWKPVGSGTFTGDGTTVSFPFTMGSLNSGYYSISITAGSTSKGTVFNLGIDITTTIPTIWAHNCAKDLIINLNSINNYRVLGLSAFLQNEASELNQQGNLVMVQMPGSTDWYNSLARGDSTAATTQFYQQLYGIKGVKPLLLKNGGYIWRKPKGDKDFEFKDDIRQQALLGIDEEDLLGNGLVTVDAAYYDLDDGLDYLAIGASATQANAGDLLVTIGCGTEYTSDNAWIDTQPGACPKEVYEAGIQMLKGMNQVYENPIHWDSILGAISNIAITAAPYLARIPTFGPALALAAGGAGLISKAAKEYFWRDTQLPANNPEIGRNEAMETVKRVTETADQLAVPARQIEYATAGVKRPAEAMEIVPYNTGGSRRRRRG